MSTHKKADAAAVLARMRAAHLESVRRGRERAALVIGGLTLDSEHVSALKVVQKALRVPSRAAAIRAAIRFTAEAAEAKQKQK